MGLTVLRALAIELVRLELIGEREEHAAGRVGRGVLAVGAGDALEAGRRNGESESKESNGELEDHNECLRNLLVKTATEVRARKRVAFLSSILASLYTRRARDGGSASVILVWVCSGSCGRETTRVRRDRSHS